MNAKPFLGFTEFERSSVSVRSNKIFTLSGIKQANRALFGKGAKEGFNEQEQTKAVAFWNKLNDNMPEWQQVQNKTLSAPEFRQEFLSAHGIGLQAIASVGKHIIDYDEQKQNKLLEKVGKINWLKSNPAWSNRAMQHGRLSKAVSNIFLTAMQIKREIGLEITPEEVAKEKKLLNA